MMKSSPVYSSATQLKTMAESIQSYLRLPLSPKTIPGALLEALIAHVRGGKVLDTYDFVDVVCEDQRVGWQIKSTKEDTPVTWKRAKIPNKEELVKASHLSPAGRQALGDAVIAFCNEHAEHSFRAYRYLDVIGFSRLIVEPSGRAATYYERVLCTRNAPAVFDPKLFSWQWTEPKKAAVKEQKSALHGIHKPTGKKWFAAHLLGENQLHFSGESTWWPKPGDPHSITFHLPDVRQRISLDELRQLLATKV